MTERDLRKTREEPIADLGKVATGWMSDAASLGASFSSVPAFQKHRGRDSVVCVVPYTSLNRMAILAAQPPALPGSTVAEVAPSFSSAGDSHGVPTLHWWRRLPAPAFTDMHVATIRKAIAGFSIINEPCWPAAARGNPAAAVGVALRAMKWRRTPSPCFDLVMSALLRCAIEGSTTATLILEYTLVRMAAKDPGCAAVAASWQAATVAPRTGHASKGA